MVRWLGILVGTLRSNRPHAPRVGAGKPRASATTGRVEGAPAAAATNGYGPALLDSAVQALEGRTPSDGDPGGVRRLLQQDSDPLTVDQGRTRATERAAAKPGQGGGGATPGWTPSRIPPESGVSRSDE